MTRPVRAALRPLLRAGLVVLLGIAGCEDEDGPLVEVDRSHLEPIGDGTWASSPWEITDPEVDGLIHIEPGSGVVLRHGLGRMPTVVTAYVGFSTEGERTMPAAGNAVEIYEVTADAITVRNGSGGDFYYRFVLR